MNAIRTFGLGLWRRSVSPVTFVILSLLWCLDLGIGSMSAYYRDSRFSVKMDAYPFKVWLNNQAPELWPHSLWVYILVGLTWLLVASLLLCTCNWLLKRRGWRRGLGEILVHLGFLMVFLGFVVGSTTGSRIQGIPVVLNGTRSVGTEAHLSLTLDQIKTILGANGNVLDTVSQVRLFSRGEEVARGEVRLNHPLIWKSAVVYPRGLRTRVQKVRLSVDNRLMRLLGEGEAI